MMQYKIARHSRLISSPNSRKKFALLPTPGLKFFANLGQFNDGVRGSYTTQGRVFKVAGTHLFELFANGGVMDYGAAGGNNNMIDDGLTVTMVAGGTVGGGGDGGGGVVGGGAVPGPVEHSLTPPATTPPKVACAQAKLPLNTL